jgi:hypothetical protein
MKRPFRYVPVTLATFLLIATALLPPLGAQTTREVEIDIAGPWAYLPDILGNDSKYIMVVAPSMSHIMSIIPEGDANHYNNSSSKPIQLSDGLYHLDFVSKCGSDRPPGVANLNNLMVGADPKLYPVKVAGPADLSAKLVTPKEGQGRYALRIPKPCYYESYVESSLKFGPTPDSKTAESTYTTWMVLHYTISVDQKATLSGTSDNHHAIHKQLSFKQSRPRSRTSLPGIAIALFMHASSTPSCDLESKEAYGYAADFWGFTASPSLFPEVTSTGEQSRRYNYDQSKCPATGHTPFVPGRTDCHAPQMDINNTVIPPGPKQQ